ncbi:MAG: hypothetical protein GKR98_16170 [Boseongicola sp.]|nr:MAG: hypothetical protein GKR98_16170 [Boseongicola sp.]
MNMNLQALTCVLVVGITPNVAKAFEFTGGVELGYSQTDTGNSDDGENLSLNGPSGSAFVTVGLEDWRATLDVNHIGRSLPAGDAFDSYAPENATAYGLHIGRQFGSAYFGGFYGKTRFQGSDAATFNGYVDGDLYGIEASQDLSFGSIFGQVGQAKMIGDGTDTAFDGLFFRVGVNANLGNQINLITGYERGSSPGIFEDEGDSGSYERFDLTAEYPFGDRVIGQVGFQMTDFQANTEDLGSETTIRVGLRIPLGKTSRRNDLKTTYLPGLAAAWAEVLD